MQVKSKISVRTVCGVVPLEKLFGKIEIVKGVVEYSAPKNLPLMRVMGFATGTVTGSSTFGDWQSLKGQFKAINLETSEATHSGTLFLPGIAHDLIAGCLTGNVSDAGVEFAIDIGALGDDTAATKYVYTATPLIELSENNPLSLLEARVMAALPAPVDEEESDKDSKPAPSKPAGKKK